MIKFGIVGTNWISESFVEACREIEGAEVMAVCSRKLETANTFAQKNNISDTYDSYEEMINSDNIDAIYIALPNSLHYHYAKEGMKKGKHILCEKPFTSNKKELEELIIIAKQNNVLLMEAIKTLALPSYHAIKEGIKRIGKIRQVNFQKYQYSSRYNEYNKGIVPNVFNPTFSGGALTDMGVYCVYPALDLFGKPVSMTSHGTVLESGVDGCGTSIWSYDDFVVTIGYSKITNSLLPSEIMGEEGTVKIDSISAPEQIIFESVRGEQQVLYSSLPKHAMAYEIEEFVSCIQANQIHSDTYSHEIALTVMETLDTMRQQLGVVYPAD